MADVVKKHSISPKLAGKMVDAAVAKARELGVSENVAIIDDGGNLKAFGGMDRAPILSAESKAYTALFGLSAQEFFNFIQGDPVAEEIVGAIGVSGAPTVQNDIDCARAALALVPDAVS